MWDETGRVVVRLQLGAVLLSRPVQGLDTTIVYPHTYLCQGRRFGGTREASRGHRGYGAIPDPGLKGRIPGRKVCLASGGRSVGRIEKCRLGVLEHGERTCDSSQTRSP
jgi:hypothetical protein